MHDTTLGDLSDDAVAVGHKCLLDLLGVAVAGRTTELSSIIHDHAVANFGAGPGSPSAQLAFDGRHTSPAGAAMAVGMTIDSIDAHDGHRLTKGHSGVHQLAALLALTQATQADAGAEFLTSLVVGYEFATRAGIALHATAADYHTSGAWGAVGCAALGARVLGLDHATTFDAMGIAEYHGPRSQMMRVIDHPTMLKDGSGWGAMAGVSAAYLAAAGFTGAPAITVNAPEVADVWGDLGQHWIIADQYFKPHPVCRWAQPAVEATLALRQRCGIDPANVERIEVATFHEAARLAVVAPTTTEQAQYSLPFPVAAAMVRGRVTGAEVTSEALADDDIVAMAHRVAIVEDQRHNDAFPARRFSRVRIVLRTGEVHESADTEASGDPEPDLALSDLQIRAKFDSFTQPVVGLERSAQIAAAVNDVLNGSVSALLDVVLPPVSNS